MGIIFPIADESNKEMEVEPKNATYSINTMESTSVKVLTDLYKKFKGLSIEEEFTLQKLVNRSMDLYCTDLKFQEKIMTYSNLTQSGSRY